jgi:RNA 2',3'-cyclic 3'-phosphodiesterase
MATMAVKDFIEHFRLFVAIAVPEKIRAELSFVQQELQPFAPRGSVRWAKPEQFHLTLQFLGDIPVNRVSALAEAIRTICAAAPPIQLRAEGIGFFPNQSSPRVFWASVKNNDSGLSDLQTKIEMAVRPFAENQGTKKFSDHVSLARFKKTNRRAIKKFTENAARFQRRIFGSWTAREVEVVRSEPFLDGMRHTVLEKISLNEIEPP